MSHWKNMLKIEQLPLRIILWTALLGVYMADAEDVVTITKFEVPPHVELHDDVVLECDHDLPAGRLFHVEWHHNDNEFYRYSTDTADRSKSQFKIPAGISVDLKASSEKKVVLLDVQLSVSGLFECVVIGEGPEYNDDKKGANLTVAVIPNTKPKIEPPPSAGLRPGSNVDLNCTAAPSIPAATLEWHINDKPAPQSSLKRYAPEKQKDELFVSRLGLNFKLERSHYKSGELKLKCTAKIATFYTKFQEHNHQRGGSYRDPKTRPATTGCAGLKMERWLQLAACALLLLRR